MDQISFTGATAPALAVTDGIPAAPLSIDDLLECGRRASDLHVLLGCIARLTPPGDPELSAAIKAACALSDELSNDLSVIAQEV